MTVCRYYLQGTCRFGDRCRFEHIDNTPDYSNRRGGGYGYQTRYEDDYTSDEPPSYNQYKHAPVDRYGQQQRHNSPNRYEPNQQYYSERNYQQHRNKNSYQYYDDASYSPQRYTSQGYSEYESYPSNQYQNKPQKNRKEWGSGEYRSNFEHKASRGPSNTFNTSTPKSKVAFSFKDPSFPSKKDQPSDLYMNQPNLLYAEVIKKDAEEWEMGNIWLFSCYTPITDKPCFPGFFDLSPEELRVEAYKAKENNAYSTYVESVNKAALEVKQRRAQLKEPSIKLMSTIEKYRNGETFGAEYNIDVGDFFSKLSSTNNFAVGDFFTKLSSNNALEEMVADEPQAPRPSIASAFSFKTTLETDNHVKTSASSFSFKLPSETSSKQAVPHGISDIYTPLEALELQDKEQFLASTFTLGKIPTVPPPQTMCFS